MTTTLHLEPLENLEAHLQRWVADGVITDDLAVRIVEEESAITVPHEEPGRGPLVTEALGYVGGVLVLVAAVLLSAHYWAHLAIGARLGLVGAGAVLLLGVGAAMPARPGSAGERLRSVAWLLSTGAVTFVLGLFAAEVLDWKDEDAALMVTAGAAIYGLALWVRSRHPLQHIAVFTLLAASGAALLAELAPDGPSGDSLPGLGILAVGVGWLLLALRGTLVPRQLALVLGGLGTVIGASVTQQAEWGRFVAVITVAALVALAMRVGEISLLAVGTLGMFLVLPNVLSTWFPGAVVAPLVLLGCGAFLVLVALKAVRRER